MPKKIILIRHGETEYNRQKKWQGWSDVPLNKAGRKQAQLLAHRLKHEVIDVLYTSDLKRAVETARAIAKSVNLQVIKTKKLRERNIGILEGVNFQESVEKYKDIFDGLFGSHDESFKGHGGESVKEVKQRIKELWNESYDCSLQIFYKTCNSETPQSPSSKKTAMALIRSRFSPTSATCRNNPTNKQHFIL